MTPTQKTDTAALLIFLLMLAFGVGIVMGRLMPGNSRRSEKSNAIPGPARTSTKKLAACRQELATLSVTHITSTAPMVSEKGPPESMNPAVKVELLKDELEQSDIAEVMVRADICSNSRAYLHFMMMLPDNPESCIAKEELADLLQASYEVCGELTIDTKVYFDTMELPEKDRKRIEAGFHHYSRKQNAEYAEWRQIVIRKCLKETGQLDE